MSASDEQKHRAIVMLAAGASQEEAAAECGVVARTIRRWVAEPEFAAEVDKQRDGMTRALDARLRALAGAAIEALGDIVWRGEDKDRIAAVRLILERVAPATQRHEVKAEALSDEELEAKMRELGYVRERG